MSNNRFVDVAVVLLVLVSSAPWLPAAEAKEIEVERDIEYCVHDDVKLAADIYRPPGKGPFPGVLVVHGGAWMSGNRNQLAMVARELAQADYVAVAISYRLAPQHLFPAQIDDCREAVRWMRRTSQKWKIDPQHIGGYGYSAGGHLVSLLGTASDEAEAKRGIPSARLQAVVAGGAPLDFRLLPANARILAYWLGGSRSEKPEIYLQASPAAFVSGDDPPCYFFHGEKDALVPVLSPVGMDILLKAAGVSSQVHKVAGAGHIQTLFNTEAREHAIEFLDQVLKRRTADASSSEGEGR
ncbi:MAG: alpha/beta hydrolase [Planctomycetales bacterium]|nr:alpha/beta hydrolase [Planctomycetales bacterium]